MSMPNQQKSLGKVIDIVSYVVFLVSALVAFDLVRTHVNYEFIDEIFHVSQTQKYCKGVFHEWDPKITTPPGLYFMGYLYYQIVRIFGSDNSCELTLLRSVNHIGGVIVLPTLLSLSNFPSHQFPISNLISFPLLAIYYCLFYTDIWSTILILFSFVAGMGQFVKLSAFLGAISLLFRQTNIIWNGFILLMIIDSKCRTQYSSTISQNINLFCRTSLRNWQLAMPFACNAVMFAVFIFYNKGITLGDKDNHSVGIHVAQLLYCSMFMCAFSAPIWFSPQFMISYIRYYVNSPYKLCRIISEMTLIAVIINKFTITHPFVLADNRHYIFYFWRKVIMRSEMSKYYLIPVYHFSIYTIVRLATKRAQGQENYSFNWISLTAFIACVCATIIPSPLFEPRYYILPFLLWRALITPVSSSLLPVECFRAHNTAIRLFAEFAYFNSINAVIFYIFINYTFEWPSEPGIIQRIIW